MLGNLQEYCIFIVLDYRDLQTITAGDKVTELFRMAGTFISF